MDHHTAYLLKVLIEWKAFCEAHPKFEEAIVAILLENKKLKLENKRLKERLK